MCVRDEAMGQISSKAIGVTAIQVASPSENRVCIGFVTDGGNTYIADNTAPGVIAFRIDKTGGLYEFWGELAKHAWFAVDTAANANLGIVEYVKDPAKGNKS